MIILGIDPGTGICGFGVIKAPDPAGDSSGSPLARPKTTKVTAPTLLDAGVISTPPHTPLPTRLEDIYDSLHEIIKTTKPDVVSIEKLFFSKNITTGISVAEARGVIMLACKQDNLPMYEYTPNEIKKTLTGYGSADKKQVQEMVRQHLNLDSIIKPDDASDALAAAITHSLLFRFAGPSGPDNPLDKSHNVIYAPSN